MPSQNSGPPTVRDAQSLTSWAAVENGLDLKGSKEAVALDAGPGILTRLTVPVTTGREDRMMGGAEVAQAPALQVIVLGSGGGPLESNTTAFLVRSVATGWTKGSLVAVDAGVHLSAITRILESTQPPGLGTALSLPHTLSEGPFAGLEVHSASASANAAHITRTLVDSFLITHPHLDHIAGFVVNTAGLGGIKPKRLAGLPSTISAFKTHIFNNIIWPNLSDENNGAGMVTYMRLMEGGSPAIGEGEGKGYLEVAEGLSVKIWGVSHGHCIERHSHRGSQSSAGTPARYGSMDGSSLVSPRSNVYPSQPQHTSTLIGPTPMSRAPSMPSHSQLNPQGESVCVYDSSAYFIRDVSTGREVIIFGDVEPDSISLSPRNLQIWQEAAPKIAAGSLGAIFIECSYDDSQSMDRMFGHLKPVFIIEELRTLAAEVEAARQVMLTKKRKRTGSDAILARRKGGLSRVVAQDDPVSPKSVRPRVGSGDEPASISIDSPHISTPTAELTLKDMEMHGDVGSQPNVPIVPLAGLKIVLIHVKDELQDGEGKGERILRELQEHEVEARLGCEFILSHLGQSLYV